MRCMYVVVTNRNTWGKGTSEVEALFNALRHDTSSSLLNVIIIKNIPIDRDLFTSVHVDELGRVHYPKNAEIEQFTVKAPSWLGRKFGDLYSDMMDLLQDEIFRVKPAEKP